jgi:peptide/nickel transport system permease protein
VKNKVKYRISQRELYKRRFRAFLREKRGMFGLCVLLFFGFMGIFIPFLADTGAIPPPYGLDSYVTSDYLPPDWIEFFPKSLIPGSGNIIPDTKFEKSDTWVYNVSDSSVMEYTYDSEEFISGSRSIKFSLVDNSSTLTYQGNIKGSLLFPWAFNPPTNASLSWYMKMTVTGNLSKSVLFPYVKLIPPEDSCLKIPSHSTNFVVLPPQHSEWMLYTRYLSFIQVFSLFQPNTTVNLEIGVDFRANIDPSLIGSITIWFDQIELQVTRPTYGLLGSNQQGQDVFIQLCYSIQASFFVAFVAGITSLIVGVIIGIIAGYRGGKFDSFMMRIVDLILIYPSLLIIFLLMFQFDVSLFFLPFFIAMFSWPSTARIIRSTVLVEREQVYIESVKASGASDWYIMFHYILPNILGIIFVQFTTNAASAINIESGLSFLDYPYPQQDERRPKRLPTWLSWGYMLAGAYYEAAFHNGAWWLIIPPGICIVLMGASFMFIGNALDRVFNPLKFQDRTFSHNF